MTTLSFTPSGALRARRFARAFQGRLSVRASAGSAAPAPRLDPDEPLPEDLWQPSRWRARFEPPGPATTEWNLLVLAILVASNVAANEVLPAWTYVPANLLTGVALLAIARRAGVTWDALGLRRDRFGRGAKVGLIVAALVAAGVLVGLAVPFSRSYFADDRFLDDSLGILLYETLFRIPLGTALFEEVAFRGVVFAILLRRHAMLTAATVSSFLFGLWHVLPSLDLLATNPAGDVADSVAAQVAAIAGGVVFTGAIGYGFIWLRLRANSLLAPVIAHTATNTLGYLAGYLVVTNGWA